MNFNNKLYTLLVVATLVFSQNAKAQLDIGFLLESGIDDTEQYLNSYLSPAFLGFGHGLNSSWYNTAKPHKVLGFDLTFSAAFAKVPDEEKLFLFSNDLYQNIQIVGQNSADLPTLFGPNTPADDLPELRFTNDQGEEVLRTSAITGLGIEDAEVNILSSGVPSAMYQLGIGLPKNTELKLRLLPTVSRSVGDDSEFSAKWFGIGILHDIKQWIPGISALPFDLSAFYGFTKVNANFIMNVNDSQSLDFGVTSNTFQAIISKKLAVFTPHVSVGFSQTNVNLSMLGEYDVDGQSAPLIDPVTFDVGNTGMRAGIGGRLKLLIFTFHGEYVIQKYPMWSAGFGINVR